MRKHLRFNNEDVSLVYLYFRKLDSKIINELRIDNSIISRLDTGEISNLFSTISIPLSVDPFSIGRKLATSEQNGYITSIALEKDNSKIEFLGLIQSKSKLLYYKHADNISSFDKSFKFYLVKVKNSSYVLAVKEIDKSSILKIKFSLSGNLIKQVFDNVDENGILTRKSGNSTSIIKDNTVIYHKQDVHIKAIDKPEDNKLFISKPNIGTIDTETFLDNDGINKIYSLGFRTNLSKQAVTYYVGKENINPDKIVLEFLDELLRAKYENINTFYCHNLSGYDIVFILKVITDYNDNVEDKYSISCTFRDDRIIKINITNKNTKRKVTFGDSLCLLNDNLRSLAKNFEVPTLKFFFPYKFSKPETLFYVGNTPDISYYNNISKEDYSKLYSNDWSFKDETIKYLKDGLNSLFEVINKANKQVFEDYNINMIDSLTISSLAMKIYLQKYYKTNIPCINKASIYNDIKKGYYGGITEVYRPYGENLYYYDVNSLYPYVGRNCDLPGLTCIK